ncbi:helix-loop-helix DNA-binding domain-containing protein [Arthroderma uncinatum]|uniref:helix-loop-helix DNA-binding domain-containing protein n=1 Tax=Arthroderma uncinatum TaxID=74035 RepID=UPI00144A9562|nr:helix-loop-helix DNA-binding domain-containing protein [Arthroderma uncinatum]KAF3481203.1 helix-loop-helix DNA-binding domain-containing protein [Arthroderma uncinatum]
MSLSASPVSPTLRAAAGTARGPSSTPCDDGEPSVKRTSNSPSDARPSTAEREKPRLSEQEKKNNHIASEQKRRAAIREGFDRLTELVPGLAGQGRSEGMVLRKTVDFMHLKLQERKDLVDEIEQRGGRVDDRLRNVTDNMR